MPTFAYAARGRDGKVQKGSLTAENRQALIKMLQSRGLTADKTSIKEKGVGRKVNLTLKRGIVDREMYDWHERLMAGLVELRNGTVEMLGGDGRQVTASWIVHGAFPCKWNGPDLNATQNSVAVEAMELCHQGLERSI